MRPYARRMQLSTTQLRPYMMEHEVNTALVMAARAKIELEPAYNYVAAALLLSDIYEEVLGQSAQNLVEDHIAHFAKYVKKGVLSKRLTPELLTYDLDRIALALKPERDRLFTYLGIQTLYDRYLIRDQNARLETPQYFWMCLGLALREPRCTPQRLKKKDMLKSYICCQNRQQFNGKLFFETDADGFYVCRQIREKSVEKSFAIA
jgi:ribonucleotide reductase alpha subunit